VIDLLAQASSSFVDDLSSNFWVALILKTVLVMAFFLVVPVSSLKAPMSIVLLEGSRLHSLAFSPSMASAWKTLPSLIFTRVPSASSRCSSFSARAASGPPRPATSSRRGGLSPRARKAPSSLALRRSSSGESDTAWPDNRTTSRSDSIRPRSSSSPRTSRSTSGPAPSSALALSSSLGIP